MMAGATEVAAISPNVQMATLNMNRGRVDASAVKPNPSPRKIAETAIVSNRRHLVAMLLTGYFLRIKRDGWAFAMTALTITFALVTFFMIMYPRVMISSLNPAWSLTIYNASSSAYTLTVMTVVAVFFVPIVLLYQGWSYWVFRKRIESKPESLTY